MSTPRDTRRLLCAPYHLYTHRQELQALLPRLTNDGWRTDVLLPFDEPAKLDAMAREAADLPGRPEVIDPTVHRWASRARPGAGARLLRGLAGLLYFARTAWLLLTRRYDLLLLTTDVGGLSVRFVQAVAARRGVPIVVLQATLFLRLAEREELRMKVSSGGLRRLLSIGGLDRLVLFCGEVPGSFLPASRVAVQNDEIRDICVQFGKSPDRVAVFGSLQSSRIAAARRDAPPRGAGPLRVLLLTECVEERFGMAMAARHVDCVRDMLHLAGDRVALTVRFHPRESQAYRDHVQRELAGLCHFDTGPDPVASAAAADVIVGVFSMLLFDAQAAGIAAVFLDVGCDPIGFYTDRRTPLVDDARALLLALETARDRPVPPSSPETDWASGLARWMAEVATRP